MRRGNFGEVMAAELLTEFYHYEVPVRKLRYALEGDVSLPGTDIIALRVVDGRLDEVCFVESKCRTTTNTGTASEAYGQLMKDAEAEIPTMVRFVADVMKETKHAASELFEDYMFSRSEMRSVETFCIFLLWEKDQWSDSVLSNLEASVTGPAQRVHVERAIIQGLKGLTEEVFLSIGVTELSDDE